PFLRNAGTSCGRFAAANRLIIECPSAPHPNEGCTVISGTNAAATINRITPPSFIMPAVYPRRLTSWLPTAGPLRYSESARISSNHHRSPRHLDTSEHPSISRDLLGRTCRFQRVVAQLHRRPSLDRHQLAHQANRFQCVFSPWMASPEVIGQQRPPSRAKPNPPSKVSVQTHNVLHIQTIGGDQQLRPRITPPPHQPRDVLISGQDRILAVDPLPGPVGHPVRRALQKLSRPERIRQHDQQCAAITLLPQFQHLVLR